MFCLGAFISSWLASWQLALHCFGLGACVPSACLSPAARDGKSCRVLMAIDYVFTSSPLPMEPPLSHHPLPVQSCSFSSLPLTSHHIEAGTAPFLSISSMKQTKTDLFLCSLSPDCAPFSSFICQMLSSFPL